METKRNNEYRRLKEQARQAAQDWQAAISETSLSYGELSEQTARLERLAHRYGLVREFRENGII